MACDAASGSARLYWRGKQYADVIEIEHNGIGVWLCITNVMVLLRLYMLCDKVTAVHTI